MFWQADDEESNDNWQKEDGDKFHDYYLFWATGLQLILEEFIGILWESIGYLPS